MGTGKGELESSGLNFTSLDAIKPKLVRRSLPAKNSNVRAPQTGSTEHFLWLVGRLPPHISKFVTNMVHDEGSLVLDYFRCQTVARMIGLTTDGIKVSDDLKLCVAMGLIGTIPNLRELRLDLLDGQQGALQALFAGLHTTHHLQELHLWCCPGMRRAWPHVAQLLACSGCKLEKLVIYGAHKARKCMQHIAWGLERNTSLKSLEIFESAHGNAGVKHLASVLHYNTVLEILLLGRVGMRLDGAEHVARALEHNTALKRLDVTWCPLEDGGVKHLASMLQHNRVLEILRLEAVGMRADGAQHIARGLEHMSSALTRLDVIWCPLGDEGVKHLASMLEKNRVLQILYLEEVGMTGTGAGFLGNALCLNETLQMLGLRNCELGDDVGLLAQGLSINRGLTGIDLKGCSLSKVGSDQLFTSLATHATLETLNVGHSYWGSPVAPRSVLKQIPSANLLATVLCSNPGLQHVDLSGGNGYSSADWVNVILPALGNNRDLKFLSLQGCWGFQGIGPPDLMPHHGMFFGWCDIGQLMCSVVSGRLRETKEQVERHAGGTGYETSLSRKDEGLKQLATLEADLTDKEIRGALLEMQNNKRPDIFHAQVEDVGIPETTTMEEEAPCGQIRQDVRDWGFAGFSLPYDSSRIMCIYKNQDLPRGDLVHMYFFHEEGMTCLVGVGVPNSLVILKADVPEIHIEERMVQDWRQMWTNVGNGYAPMLFENVEMSNGEIRPIPAAQEAFMEEHRQHFTEEFGSSLKGTSLLHGLMRSLAPTDQAWTGESIRVQVRGSGESSGGGYDKPVYQQKSLGTQIQDLDGADLISDTGIDKKGGKESRDKFLTVLVTFNPYECQILEVLEDRNTRVISSTGERDGLWERDGVYGLKTTMKVEFFYSEDEDDSRGFREMEVTLSTGYELDSVKQLAKDSSGWYHQHLSSSLICHDDSAVDYIASGINTPLVDPHRNLVVTRQQTRGTLRSRSYTLGMSVGVPNVPLGVDLGATRTSERTNSLTTGQELSSAISTLHLTGTGFRINDVSNVPMVSFVASLSHCIDTNDLWTEDTRKLAIEARMLSKVEYAMWGRWELLPTSEPYHKYEACMKRDLFCKTRSFRQRKKVLGFIDQNRSPTDCIRTREMEQKLAKTFLISRTFDHTYYNTKEYKWRIQTQPMCPVPKIIKGAPCHDTPTTI